MATKNKIEVLLTADGVRLQNELNKAKTGLEKFSKAGSQVSASLSTSFSGLAGMIGSAFAVSSLIQAADTYTMIEGRLRLVTDSTAQLVAVQSSLYDIAQETRSSFTDTANVYSRFAQATKDIGTSQTELLTMTKTLNQAFVISGASTGEASAAMLQLSQGFASGVLRGDEFNSVMESGGRVVQMLTDYTGKSRGELRKMAEDGQITADVLRNAIAAGAEKINSEFGKMPSTVGQSMQILQNAFGSVVDWANDSTGATKGLASTIKGISSVVEEIPDFVEWAAGEMMIAWDGVTRNFEVSALTIKSVFFVAFDQIAEKIADSMDTVYSTIDDLPGITVSLDAWENVAALRDLSTASEDYRSGLTAINSAHDLTVASYRETQRELTTTTNNAKDLTTSAESTIKPFNELAKTTLPETAKALKDVGMEYASLSQQLGMMKSSGVNTGSQLGIMEKIFGVDTDSSATKEAVKRSENIVSTSFDTIVDKGNTTASALEDAFTGWASNISQTLNDVVWDANASFGDILTSFGKMITQMVLQTQVIQPLMQSITGGGGPSGSWVNPDTGFTFGGILDTIFSAKGNVFSTPGLSAYSNSIVSKPTLFPFAKGIGMMGEAGAEAILPLKRGSDGKLGVAGGGGNVTVNINNNASGTQATATQRQNSDGSSVIDVMIDQIDNALAGRVSRGSGSLTNAMASTYGLNRVAGSY